LAPLRDDPFPRECLGEVVVGKKIIPRLAECIEFIETEIAKLEAEHEVAKGATASVDPQPEGHTPFFYWVPGAMGDTDLGTRFVDFWNFR
jgi:hypothetical protein